MSDRSAADVCQSRFRFGWGWFVWLSPLSCRFVFVVMICRVLSVAIYCAWTALGAPTLNVISEGPAALADATGQDLRAAADQVASFAASVRAATNRMSVEAQRVVHEHSAALSFLSSVSPAPAAGFLGTRDAHSELKRLSSLFHAVPGDADGAHAEPSPTKESDATTTVESSMRNLLLDAGRKFAAASGGEEFIPASFLQPVDANFLRESLRLTEPMRSPSPMTVNVITAEDVPALRRGAIYKGLASQTAALHNNFDADVAALGGL